MIDRETFERLSAMLKPCPLCGDKDVQLNTHPEIKPDANCNRCGISFQGQTVDEVVEQWNRVLSTLRMLGTE
jgi:Lar family restriction alleviation protein